MWVDVHCGGSTADPSKWGNFFGAAGGLAGEALMMLVWVGLGGCGPRWKGGWFEGWLLDTFEGD